MDLWLVLSFVVWWGEFIFESIFYSESAHKQNSMRIMVLSLWFFMMLFFCVFLGFSVELLLWTTCGVSGYVGGWITRWWVAAENGSFEVVIMELMVDDVRWWWCCSCLKVCWFFSSDEFFDIVGTMGQMEYVSRRQFEWRRELSIEWRW